MIAYASWILHEAEKNDQNYSAFKLELLALKWTVVEKFKDYLWGAKFNIYTDQRPLLHLRSAKLRAVELRWAGQIASFKYELLHKPGKEHQNADALSRQPGVLQVAQVGPEEEWAERGGCGSNEKSYDWCKGCSSTGSGWAAKKGGAL